MKKRWLWLLLALLLFSAGAYFVIQQLFRTSPVTGKLLPVAASAAAGETLTITAEVQMPAGCRVSDALLHLPEGWTAAGSAEFSDSPAFDLTRLWQVSARAVPMLTGKSGTGRLMVHIRDITGQELPPWEASFELPAAADAGNTAAAPLPLYIAGPIAEKDGGGSLLHWLWLLVPAAVAVILLLLVKRRRKQPPQKTFWEKTMEELAGIKEEIPRSRDLNKLLARLTDTVRDYLEKRFDLPASRRTTPEFLAMLAQPGTPLGEKDKTALQTFLAKADLVKFACVNAERDLLEKACSDAAGLVAGTRPGNVEEEEKKNV